MEANHAMNAHEGDLISSKATESLRLFPSAHHEPLAGRKNPAPVFSDLPLLKILSLADMRLL
jgi:hypothetical protein